MMTLLAVTPAQLFHLAALIDVYLSGDLARSPDDPHKHPLHEQKVLCAGLVAAVGDASHALVPVEKTRWREVQYRVPMKEAEAAFLLFLLRRAREVYIDFGLLSMAPVEDRLEKLMIAVAEEKTTPAPAPKPEPEVTPAEPTPPPAPAPSPEIVGAPA